MVSITRLQRCENVRDASRVTFPYLSHTHQGRKSWKKSWFPNIYISFILCVGGKESWLKRGVCVIEWRDLELQFICKSLALFLSESLLCRDLCRVFPLRQKRVRWRKASRQIVIMIYECHASCPEFSFFASIPWAVKVEGIMKSRVSWGKEELVRRSVSACTRRIWINSQAKFLFCFIYSLQRRNVV